MEENLCQACANGKLDRTFKKLKFEPCAKPSDEIQLSWDDEADAYFLPDSTVDFYKQCNIVPILKINQESTGKKVAVLLGRETASSYGIATAYIAALQRAGLSNIYLLDYENVEQQMIGMQALLLPGGCFTSPEQFYTDANVAEDKTSKRAVAYFTAIKCAEAMNIPVLGICAGAQMIAGVQGVKMNRKVQGHSGGVFHRIKLFVDTPLRELVGKDVSLLEVNSYHSEAMVANSFEERGLKLYAIAADGTPEAWGKGKELCLQFHPEKTGDPYRLFRWLAQ